MSEHDAEGAYVFYSDGLKGNRFHFRTFSLWIDSGKHLREIRKADVAYVPTFTRALSKLGDTYRWLSEARNISLWIREGGWVLVPKDLARTMLKPMLQPRTCVRSPMGIYFDVQFPRGLAANRRATKRVRDQVLARDGHRCVKCRRGRSEGVVLTMDHVLPYSRGGETTVHNLVTLCRSCNQAIADKDHLDLFSLAGLHYGWDETLIKAVVAPDAWRWAISISGNLMISYCDPRAIGGGEQVGQAQG